jgi:hypothetical protein
MWLAETLPTLSVTNETVSTFVEVEQSFNTVDADNFQIFLHSETFAELKDNGLLLF